MVGVEQMGGPGGGVVEERLGFLGEPGVDIEIVLRSHGLPPRFPQPVVEEAERYPSRVSTENLLGLPLLVWRRFPRLRRAYIAFSLPIVIWLMRDFFAALPLEVEEARLKSKIMQRILINDAEIRQLAEPWLERVTRRVEIRHAGGDEREIVVD